MSDMRHIIMLGTSPDANGGIASVVSLYKQEGIFERQNIRYLSTHTNGGKTKKLTILLLALLKFSIMLATKRIEAVHVHAAADLSFWRKSIFVCIACLFAVPSIYHLHSGRFPAYYNRSSTFRKNMMKYLLRKAKYIVVVSDALNEWAESLVKKSNVITILNPVVIPDTVNDSEREKSTILFLGRLGEAKGTFDLLNAMKIVTTSLPESRLILCGDGMIDRTRSIIKSLELEKNVQLPGWVDNNTRTNLLRKATIFVLPSYAEGLPMSVLEAMSSGLAVVATTVGGIPELITDSAQGILIRPGDVEALAAAIIRLIETPDERSRLASAARTKTATMFTRENTTGRLEKLYRDIRTSNS